MAPVSSDLEIVAVRASMEADSRGDHVGRDATGFFNTNRDRTPLENTSIWSMNSIWARRGY